MVGENDFYLKNIEFDIGDVLRDSVFEGRLDYGLKSNRF